MLELISNTPVNLSKPGSPAFGAPAKSTVFSPAHSSRPPCHELVVVCEAHTSTSAMAPRQVPVTFTYHKNGTEPPVFVAGTFTSPPWEPLEMDSEQDVDGHYTFSKTATADEDTEIQYKFRIGTGNWWVLDGNETVGKWNGVIPQLLSCAG